MGTWKITKETTKDGKVCLQTEATDKLEHMIRQQKPHNMVSFYEM